MMQKKVAILVDSGSDVPKDFAQEHHIFVAPLKIIYKDQEYEDRLDITPEEIYARLEEEIPKTSLPGADRISSLFDQIIKEGYDTVLVITISSGLSGTFNMIRMMAQQYAGLDVRFVDTKSIGIGSGMHAILAARMLKSGKTIDEIVPALEESVAKSHVYFCLDTLEYLAKGGRIGLVAAVLGSLLKLRPVISCNKDGIYETVVKVRGSAQALAKTISIAVSDAKRHARYAIAVAHGSALDVANKVIDEMKRLLPDSVEFIKTDVSPALSVHTGPGLIGVAVQALPEGI